MKVLIIRFSSIGDIVLTSPVLRCLKKQTGAEIHFLTKSSYQGILASNPYVSKVYTINKSISGQLAALKNERYDAVIDLHNNLRSRLLTFKLGVPSTAFKKLNIEKWLLVRLHINCMPKQHIVARYMATVAHLGVEYDGQGLDYFIPKDAEIQLESLDSRLVDAPYTAFVLGATHATKRLPIEKIKEFCVAIPDFIALLGGPDEQEVGQQLEAHFPEKVCNLAGKLSLNGSASIVQQAHQVYTHDTGLMHIAAALDKKIISIWGSTVPDFGMYPFYADGKNKNQSLEVLGLSCRPCSKIGFDRCPKGHFNCMQLQKTLINDELSTDK